MPEVCCKRQVIQIHFWGVSLRVIRCSNFHSPSFIMSIKDNGRSKMIGNRGQNPSNTVYYKNCNKKFGFVIYKFCFYVSLRFCAKNKLNCKSMKCMTLEFSTASVQWKNWILTDLAPWYKKKSRKEGITFLNII